MSDHLSKLPAPAPCCNHSANLTFAVPETPAPSAAINFKIGNERLIKVTENASRKLNSLLEKQGRATGALRVAVIGGGCSGLQYKMDLVDGPANRDIMVQSSNVRVVVDPKSALFVSGSLLDYSDDLQKGRVQSDEPECSGALLLRRELRCMIDYFALLDQPRAPWLDPEKLKQVYHQKTLRAHPDTAAPGESENSFAQLNEAYQVLQDPKRRLHHLLELEGRPPSSTDQTVPRELHDLFPAIGALTQRASGLLEKITTASNALSRSLLKPQILEVQKETKELREKIQGLSDSSLDQLASGRFALEEKSDRRDRRFIQSLFHVRLFDPLVRPAR